MTTWQDCLGEEKAKPYFQQVMAFVQSEREMGKTIYPAHADIFNALKLTPLEQVNVVILGQDPYHGPNQAHGLCFSVQRRVKTPPSLVNIYKELQTDVEGFTIPSHGDLTQWASQGVLLLNTVLTVEQGNAHSHAKKGWEQFTDAVIDAVNAHTSGTVFLLWGSHAQKKEERLDTTKHHILKAPHPSPLSAHRGFFGSRHFSQTNSILESQGKPTIDWMLSS